MKNFIIIIAISLFSSHLIIAQHSKKGFEYSGTKMRVSLIGKSKMFSEGVKTINYSLYWNKKKQTLQVNAGEKDSWYTIQLTQMDTIQGNETHIGYLEGTSPNPDATVPDKNRCEIRFLMDRITVKKGGARLEEFLIDGASVWNDQHISTN